MRYNGSTCVVGLVRPEFEQGGVELGDAKLTNDYCKYNSFGFVCVIGVWQGLGSAFSGFHFGVSPVQLDGAMCAFHCRFEFLECLCIL